MNVTRLFAQYKGLRRENYILFFGRIVTNLGSMIWPVLTLILNQKLGMNATSVAFILIIAGVIQMPFGLWSGKLADRMNKKHLIIIFDTISIFFYIICAFLPLSNWSIVLIMVAATCQTIERPAYNALVADLTETKDRERAFSLMYLGGNIGLIASPAIAGMLFANYLWLSFLISGVAIASSTILIFFMIQDVTPAKNDVTEDYQNSRENDTLLTVLKENKVVLFFILLMAFYHGAYAQYGYLMPLDMARVHGEDGAVLYGSVASLNCIIVVLFTPLITQIFSKICYTRKSLIGTVLLLCGYVVFLVGLGHIPSYYMAIILFTWGEIFNTIVYGPYVTERIPATHRGRVNGMMDATEGLLTNGAMLIVGLLYDRVSSTSAWIFTIVLVIVTILGTIGLIPADRKAYRNLYNEH